MKLRIQKWTNAPVQIFFSICHISSSQFPFYWIMNRLISNYQEKVLVQKYGGVWPFSYLARQLWELFYLGNIMGTHLCTPWGELCSENIDLGWSSYFLIFCYDSGVVHRIGLVDKLYVFYMKLVKRRQVFENVFCILRISRFFLSLLFQVCPRN